jgi:hypothetical protein
MGSHAWSRSTGTRALTKQPQRKSSITVLRDWRELLQTLARLDAHLLEETDTCCKIPSLLARSPKRSVRDRDAVTDGTPGPRSGFCRCHFLASGSAAPDTVEGSWNPDSFYESVATLFRSEKAVEHCGLSCEQLPPELCLLRVQRFQRLASRRPARCACLYEEPA